MRQVEKVKSALFLFTLAEWHSGRRAGWETTDCVDEGGGNTVCILRANLTPGWDLRLDLQPCIISSEDERTTAGPPNMILMFKGELRSNLRWNSHENVGMALYEESSEGVLHLRCSVWTLQAAVQMSLCMASHYCLLVLPVMSLLLLLSPIGWSYDGLTPGCHLHRELPRVQCTVLVITYLSVSPLSGSTRDYGYFSLKNIIITVSWSSFLIPLSCPPPQPLTWPSVVTVAAHVKAPTWSTPAWATVSPAPSHPGTPCWWPPTSPTTSPLLHSAAPSARTLRWGQGESDWTFEFLCTSIHGPPSFPQVKVRLDCPRGRHHDEIEILTAKACRCDMCRKSRYWHVSAASCVADVHKEKNQTSALTTERVSVIHQ